MPESSDEKVQVRPAMGVRLEPVSEPGAAGVQVRWLVGPDSGAPTFHMRQFEVAPGGHTPRHQHPWEHECYILEGQGEVHGVAGGTRTVRPGDVVYVPAGQEHQFRNNHWNALKFLCMIPAKPCDCAG